MKTFAQQFVTQFVLPLIIGYAGAMLGVHTNVAVLEERIAGVKESADAGILEAKQLAQGAHTRIDSFLLGAVP